MAFNDHLKITDSDIITPPHKVYDMIVRMRKENAAYEKPLTPQIENLVLIDRRVDLMTPMCTQLTYEVCNHIL